MNRCFLMILGRLADRRSSVTETIERLCGAVGDGMPIRGACVIAGIGVTTLQDWREKYSDLEERIVDAREHARLKGLQAIKAAGTKIGEPGQSG
jgi:hypothetical protein